MTPRSLDTLSSVSDLAAAITAPSAGELLVWQWRVAGTIGTPADLKRLTAAEQDRLDRFRVEPARQQYLAARVGLRLVLGAMLACPPERVAITESPTGKPRLATGGPRFNIAHSGELIVAAFARNEVGIDIERVRPVTSLAALVDKYFTPAERHMLSATAGAEQLEVFFRLWTRKEAVVKLIGLGLRVPVGQLEVPAVETYCGEIRLPASWQTPIATAHLTSLALSPGYIGAVATSST